MPVDLPDDIPQLNLLDLFISRLRSSFALGRLECPAVFQRLPIFEGHLERRWIRGAPR